MIKIENLSVAFEETLAVNQLNLEIYDGEILGIVGESGSGKSVTALSIMGLLSSEATIKGGSIRMGQDWLIKDGQTQDKDHLRKAQGNRMSMVFQEPMTSLNPTQKVGRQVDEVLVLHTQMETQERYEKVLEAFKSVGLKDVEKVYDSYPHQLSGGMRQRVMIAMAIILKPELLIADEPTTALDVRVQSQIIQVLRKINKEQKTSMLFITHDLNLARRICNRIAVMKDGKLVEIGPTEEVFGNPKEAYTRKLIEAVPSRVKEKEDAPESTEETSVNILEVRDLNVYYHEGSNSLFGQKKKRCVVENATFHLEKGETLGLVGESGCGKTSLCKAILGMNKLVEGEVKHYSVRPQMVFQDPYSSLNPAKTIGWLLQEPLRAAGKLDPAKKMTDADMKAAAYDMLQKIGMPEKYFYRWPSQLSGGQRQRISIGQALITRPGLVIADEPVSALDVTIQAQIMELMQKLQEELQLSYLFISHDINVIYKMSDRIMVMKDGKIVEVGDKEVLFTNPKEEYTKLLFAES